MAKKMNRTIQVLMDRDGLSYEEAVKQFSLLQGEAWEIAEDGDYEEMEDLLLDYGLEMDYLDDLIF